MMMMMNNLFQDVDEKFVAATSLCDCGVDVRR